MEPFVHLEKFPLQRDSNPGLLLNRQFSPKSLLCHWRLLLKEFAPFVNSWKKSIVVHDHSILSTGTRAREIDKYQSVRQFSK